MTENISTNEALEKPKPLPIPESKWRKIFYGFVVIVLPVVCFTTTHLLDSYDMLMYTEWQSGEPQVYAKIFLSVKVSWIFFPLIAYSSISTLLLLIFPSLPYKYEEKPVIG